METLHPSSFKHDQLESALLICQGPLESATAICPFCANDSKDGETGDSLLMEKTLKQISSYEVKRHLRHHLEQLALFAIPLAIRGAEEDDENEGSKAAKSPEFACEVCDRDSENDGLNYCMARAAVYCKTCWDLQRVHRRQVSQSSLHQHEKLDPQTAERLEKDLSRG